MIVKGTVVLCWVTTDGGVRTKNVKNYCCTETCLWGARDSSTELRTYVLKKNHTRADSLHVT